MSKELLAEEHDDDVAYSFLAWTHDRPLAEATWRDLPLTPPSALLVTRPDGVVAAVRLAHDFQDEVVSRALRRAIIECNTWAGFPLVGAWRVQPASGDPFLQVQVVPLPPSLGTVDEVCAVMERFGPLVPVARLLATAR